MTPRPHISESDGFMPASAPYPPLPSDRPTKDDPKITFGEWEPDPDTAPIYKKLVRTPRAARDWMLFGAIAEAYPTPGGYRRKRFEAWWEDGRPMGRWVWDKRGPW